MQSRANKSEAQSPDFLLILSWEHSSSHFSVTIDLTCQVSATFRNISFSYIYPWNLAIQCGQRKAKNLSKVSWCRMVRRSGKIFHNYRSIWISMSIILFTLFLHFVCLTVLDTSMLSITTFALCLLAHYVNCSTVGATSITPLHSHTRWSNVPTTPLSFSKAPSHISLKSITSSKFLVSSWNRNLWCVSCYRNILY